MRAFDYRRAASVAEAVAAVGEATAGDGAEGGATAVRYLGGGTNLVDLMKLGVEVPEVVVDVSRLDEGGTVETPSGGVRVGAAVRNSELAAEAVIRERYPVLSQALLAGASGQLRNMATVGGNFLQRTRCRYFQDVSKPCNKRRPGSGCPAIEGEHHNLAILGASPQCVATHPSDMAVAMVALDAVVHLRGPAGARDLPVDELYRLPGEHPERDTTLRPGELITAVSLPPLAASRSRYRKVRERSSFAFAVASVAAVVELDRRGHLGDVRLALGGVAHRPWRARRAEAELRGGRASAEAFRAAIGRELEAARPLRDNAYKVPLVTNLVTSVLTELTERTEPTS